MTREEPARVSLAVRAADRVLRVALRGLGGVWLVLSGRGLPRAGEDRVWREIHPDDDR